MLKYQSKLKTVSRLLRSNSTDSENILWSRLRRKQLLGVQFYRQKPIGGYVVDFFALKPKLVIEIDGSQHLDDEYLQKDIERDKYLSTLGLHVLRFDSRTVLLDTDEVVEIIFRKVYERLKLKIPPDPPFSKGGTK